MMNLQLRKPLDSARQKSSNGVIPGFGIVQENQIAGLISDLLANPSS